MATRANIILPGAILYRHYDGYPSGGILRDIAAWIACERGIASEMQEATSYSPSRPFYESMDCVAGDAEWIYIVNARRRTVRVYERSLLRTPHMFRAANARLWCVTTGDYCAQKLANAETEHTRGIFAEAVAQHYGCAELCAEFEARTGYKLVVPAPRPVKPSKPAPVPALVERGWVGKGEQGLDVVEIAKRLRREYREMQRAGAIPAGDVSVRCRRYSGGRSIDVTFTPTDTSALVDREYVAECVRGVLFDDDPYSNRVRRGDASASRVLAKTMEAAMDAYNYDHSDSMTDYFNVHFYGNVEICGVYEAERAEVAREVEAQRAAGVQS